MKKENFTKLLQRNNPEEILDFVKKHGKGPKSINPLVFYDNDTKNGNDKSNKKLYTKQ